MLTRNGSKMSSMKLSPTSKSRRSTMMMGMGRRESRILMGEPGSGKSLLRFNPKTKIKKPEHERQKEITNKKFENLCYDATYRV